MPITVASIEAHATYGGLSVLRGSPIDARCR
jgi:hypothetical protein